MGLENSRIVIVNQAANYLTIGICNEFAARFQEVTLLTGSVHVQGEELSEKVKIDWINKWQEEHGVRKVWIYFRALYSIYFRLLFKYRKHEVFFVSVPPMAYLLNLILPNRSSVLVWDVYPDTLKIMGMQESHVVFRVWSRLNKWSFSKAHRVITIGERMKGLLAKYVKSEKVLVQPIWSIFQKNEKVDKSENPFIRKHGLNNKFIVQYSGNIGLTHKVEILIDIAERMKDNQEVLFQIIGRGPRKAFLENEVNKRGLQNCQFLPFQSDDMFPYSLSAADLGVVILDSMTSKGSVPSKSYNLMSFGIPSLYIASKDSELYDYSQRFGHARCFDETELSEVVGFVLKISQDDELANDMKTKSLEAAKNFKRINASKMVESYMQKSDVN